MTVVSAKWKPAPLCVIAPSRIHRGDPEVVSGGRHQQRSCFSDPIWDFSGVIMQPNLVHEGVLRFDATLGPSWQLAIREVLVIHVWGLGAFKRASPHSIRQWERPLRVFAVFAQQCGVHSPSGVTPRLIDEYAARLRHERTADTLEVGRRCRAEPPKRRNDHTLVRRLLILQMWWSGRQFITEPLSFDPFKYQSPKEMLGVESLSRRKIGNTTPPIPTEVFRPYFSYAWKYVSIFSADILTVLIERAECEARHLAAGLKPYSLYPKLIRIYRNERRRFSLDPDTGKPWRVAWETHEDFERDHRALVNACMVVIMFPSGVRPGEGSDIREGCVTQEKTADGIRDRLRLWSRLFKGQKHPRRVPWTVIPEVSVAVKALTAATAEWRRRGNTDLLYCNSNGAVVGASDFPRRLRAFRDHVNARFGNPIPEWDGKPWPFTPRQLRRTCARFIAREPWGVVAGARQFKHISVAIFEGYANVREMPLPLREFHEDIEEERLLAEADWGDEIITAVGTGEIAGPGGTELLNEFRGLVIDRGEEEARRLLRNQLKGAPIHAVRTNFCRFRREKALCLSLAGKARSDLPVITFCEPGRCANSCITKRHTAAWKHVIDDHAWAAKQAPAGSPARSLILKDKARAEALIAPVLGDV